MVELTFKARLAIHQRPTSEQLWCEECFSKELNSAPKWPDHPRVNGMDLWDLWSTGESFSSVQFVVQSCPTLCDPWTVARQASLSITNFRSSPKLTSIESVMPFNYLILCHPLLPPSIFPSIWIFSNESAFRIRWPQYWSFSFYIGLSNEHPGLISFRMDWLDLLAVQGTLKILLQHHSSKASILQRSAFFTVQLSHPYMIIGKTIALTRWTFVDKVMSLLFNICLGWFSISV